MKSTINGLVPFTLCKKLKKCRQLLKQWNKDHFGYIWEKTRRLQCQINELQLELHEANYPERLIVEERILLQRHEQAIIQEEMHWCQKTRVDYLRHGDQNTKFFHTMTISSRKRNEINRIFDKNQKCCKSRETIGETFVDYCRDLFTTSNPKQDENLLLCIPRLVNGEKKSKAQQESH